MAKRRTLTKTKRDPNAINRFGGAPIGIGEDDWPMIFNPNTGEKQPMIHVLTIATSKLWVQVDHKVEGLALFASSSEMPFYFDDPTADYEVVQLTKRQIERGELDGPDLPEPALEASGLEIGRDEADGNTFVGGKPKGIQEDLPERDFVLQMDWAFSGLNLGDSGNLYMFTTWACWDCH